MRYIVERDCHGFQKRFWSKGEEVEVEKGVEVPCHFRPLEIVEIEEIEEVEKIEEAPEVIEVVELPAVAKAPAKQIKPPKIRQSKKFYP